MVVSLERSIGVGLPKKWATARRLREHMMLFAAQVGGSEGGRKLAARLWKTVRHDPSPLLSLTDNVQVWAKTELGYDSGDIRSIAALKFALLASGLGEKLLMPLDEAEKGAVRAALPIAIPAETLTEMPVQSLVKARKPLKVMELAVLPSKV